MNLTAVKSFGDAIVTDLVSCVTMTSLKGEIYIPEVLIAARAMHAGMAILNPILSKTASAMAGKVVVGTVKGDLHDIETTLSS